MLRLRRPQALQRLQVKRFVPQALPQLPHTRELLDKWNETLLSGVAPGRTVDFKADLRRRLEIVQVKPDVVARICLASKHGDLLGIHNLKDGLILVCRCFLDAQCPTKQATW